MGGGYEVIPDSLEDQAAAMTPEVPLPPLPPPPPRAQQPTLSSSQTVYSTNGPSEVAVPMVGSGIAGVEPSRFRPRHVIGCRLTQDTRVRSALDDVESNVRQAVLRGCWRGRPRSLGGIGGAAGGRDSVRARCARDAPRRRSCARRRYLCSASPHGWVAINAFTNPQLSHPATARRPSPVPCALDLFDAGTLPP